MDARIYWIRAIAVGAVLSIATGAAGAGEVYRTSNFEIKAPDLASAKRIGEHAETCREAIAKAWLGKPLPRWKVRCPVQVKLTLGEAGGVTTFDFGPKGGVVGQTMSVEGRIDRILASALPHEITHTVFAAYLGEPMPRWADEGASLLSEDERELARHNRIVVDLLARKGQFTIAQLFEMEEYPRDLMGFYGQGYSVSRFLVELGGRRRFLEFIRDGGRGWEDAVAKHYGLADLRELERAWRAWHDTVREDPERSRKPTSPLVVKVISPAELDPSGDRDAAPSGR